MKVSLNQADFVGSYENPSKKNFYLIKNTEKQFFFFFLKGGFLFFKNILSGEK